MLKPPPLSATPVRVYFDIEGIPEKTFAYLLGMIVDDQGTETTHSLWADSAEDEQAIFGRMIEILSRYDDFTLFHFGSYESSFLRRMKKTIDGNPTFNKLLARTLNILPIIRSHIYFPVYSTD